VQYFVGDGGDLFLVEALGDLDDLGDPALVDGQVEGADVFDAEDPLPEAEFAEDTEEFRLGDVR